jgi:predicted phosphohydrolase
VRIVAVADTHTFEAELGAIPDGDVFVHAGDMLRAGSLDELVVVAAWIRRLPHRHKIVVAGNHDCCFETRRASAAACALLDGVTYLQDAGVTLDGVRFWGSPWQPAYNDWAFNLPRGAPLAAKWAAIPPDIDVLITHGPPLGHGDRGPVEGRAGCEDLLQRVREVRPLLHLSGHIHQDGGLTRAGATTFANVTTWECERGPTVLDVDVAARSVVSVVVPARAPPRR